VGVQHRAHRPVGQDRPAAAEQAGEEVSPHDPTELSEPRLGE
jgi:hypothetical protein